MPSITRKLEFDYGHRLVNHTGRCRFIHGHRGIVEITVSSEILNTLGMVIDFSKVKEIINGWILEHMDHNLILNPDDPLMKFVGFDSDGLLFGGRDPYVMPPGKNPTAENLADELYHVAVELLLPLNIKVDKVRFYETPNSWADSPS